MFENRARLHAALLAVLGGCGGTVLVDGDAGPDAADVKVGDVKVETGCVESQGQCCCFDNPVACDQMSFTFDASFELCGDAEAGSGCVANEDCSEDLGALAAACRAADFSTGDPYPTNGHFTCLVLSEDAGLVTVQCNRFQLCGRRLEGLVQPRHGGTACGSAFAEMAWLEAASVRAFSRLARDLERHRAPRALVEAAKRAAREEARHARIMSRIARRFGAKPSRVRVRRVGRRTLEAIALENAVEGCVHETHGALLAMWQSQRAADPDIRRALAQIAPDELGHAALAWDIAQWAETRLAPEATARVRRARDAAVATLAQGTDEPPPELVRVAGMPSARDAMKLRAGLLGALYHLRAGGSPSPRSSAGGINRARRRSSP